jgi:hypothetical protein
LNLRGRTLHDRWGRSLLCGRGRVVSKLFESQLPQGFNINARVLRKDAYGNRIRFTQQAQKHVETDDPLMPE